MIRDGDGRPAAGGLGGHVDARIAGSRGVLAGVVDEVEEYLLDGRGTRAHDGGGRRIRGLDDELHARPIGALHETFPRAQEEVAGRERLVREHGAAPLDARVREHVLDQMAEAIRLRAERAQILRPLLLGRHHALGEHLGVHPEGRERGPELVRHGGDERAAALAQPDRAREEREERAGGQKQAGPGDEERDPDRREERGRLLGKRAGEQARGNARKEALGAPGRRVRVRFDVGAGENVADRGEQKLPQRRPVQDAALQVLSSADRHAAREHEVRARPQRGHGAVQHLGRNAALGGEERRGLLLDDRVARERLPLGLVARLELDGALALLHQHLLLLGGCPALRGRLGELGLGGLRALRAVRRGRCRLHEVALLRLLDPRDSRQRGAAEVRPELREQRRAGIELLSRDEALALGESAQRALGRLGRVQRAAGVDLEVQPDVRRRAGEKGRGHEKLPGRKPGEHAAVGAFGRVERAVHEVRLRVLLGEERREHELHAPQGEPYRLLGRGQGARIAFGPIHAERGHGEPEHRREHQGAARGARDPRHGAAAHREGSGARHM